MTSGSRASIFRFAAPLLTALLTVLTLPATAQNPVIDWNNIAINEARASSAPGAATPGSNNIYLAYVELAVYNAVVAIQGGYEPYKITLTAPHGASADAAAIEAAYRVLVYLLPDRTSTLTTSYVASLAAIPNGVSKSNGQAVGLSSANALISLRTGDGRGVRSPTPIPPHPSPASGSSPPAPPRPSLPGSARCAPSPSTTQPASALTSRRPLSQVTPGPTTTTR